MRWGEAGTGAAGSHALRCSFEAPVPAAAGHAASAPCSAAQLATTSGRRGRLPRTAHCNPPFPARVNPSRASTSTPRSGSARFASPRTTSSIELFLQCSTIECIVGGSSGAPGATVEGRRAPAQTSCAITGSKFIFFAFPPTHSMQLHPSFMEFHLMAMELQNQHPGSSQLANLLQ